MKKTLSLYEFLDEVEKYEDRRGQFSREGLEAIYNYITSIEEDTGEETEFDFIAICCEFAEYKNEKEVLKSYGLETIEELEENTMVIKIDGTERLIVVNY